jgi:hypothetical protein
MCPFIVVGGDVAVNNIGRKGVQQWVFATPLQSYIIFRLLIIIIIIIIINIVCACVRAPVFLPYLSLMQIASFLRRHL